MPCIDASVPGPGLRPHRAALPACPHGGIGDAELRALGLRRTDVLDFSASPTPLGPSPRVAEALTGLAAGGDLGRYPDDGCPRLREALAAHTGCPPDQLIVANGSVEILWLLALAYLGPGDRVLVVGPTFGEYARAARIAGAAVVEWRAAEARSFRPDPDALAAAIRRTCPRLVFLCNPNNPTGVLLDRAVVTRLLAALQEGLLVVDEAYAAFADDAPRLSPLLGDCRRRAVGGADCPLFGCRVSVRLGGGGRAACARLVAPVTEGLAHAKPHARPLRPNRLDRRRPRPRRARAAAIAHRGLARHAA